MTMILSKTEVVAGDQIETGQRKICTSMRVLPGLITTVVEKCGFSGILVLLDVVIGVGRLMSGLLVHDIIKFREHSQNAGINRGIQAVMER